MDLALWSWVAKRDFEDVILADALVLHNPKEWVTEGRGGRHVETGMVLARTRPVIVVGERSNVFHSLQRVFIVSTIEAAVNVLDLIDQHPSLAPWNSDR